MLLLAAAHEWSTRWRLHLLFPALLAAGLVLPTPVDEAWQAFLLLVLAPLFAVGIAAPASRVGRGPAAVLGRASTQAVPFAGAIGALSMPLPGLGDRALAYALFLLTLFLLATAARALVTGVRVLAGIGLGVAVLGAAVWAAPHPMRWGEPGIFAFDLLVGAAILTWETRPPKPLLRRLAAWCVGPVLVSTAASYAWVEVRAPWHRYVTSAWPDTAVLLAQGPDPDTALLLTTRGDAGVGRAVLWKDGTRTPIGPAGVLRGTLGPHGAVTLVAESALASDIASFVFFADGRPARCALPEHASWTGPDSPVWRADGQAYVVNTPDGAFYEADGCTFIAGVHDAAFLGDAPVWMAGQTVYVDGKPLVTDPALTGLVPVGRGVFAVGYAGAVAVIARVHPDRVEVVQRGGPWFPAEEGLCGEWEPRLLTMNVYDPSPPRPTTCWRPDDSPGVPAPEHCFGLSATWDPETRRFTARGVARTIPDRFDPTDARLLSDGRLRIYAYLGWFELGADGTVTARRWGVKDDTPVPWTGSMASFEEPLTEQTVW
jgi:hypothetical protein